MKKFWMISMLLIAALFVISCGGDDEGGESSSCTTQGAFKCDGDVLQKCDQETWKPFENCAESGKTCNAEAGKCEAKGGNQGGNEGGNEGGNQGGNEGGNEGGNQGGTLTCTEIYQCYANCQDEACVNECVAGGTKEGQDQFISMYNCWYNNCASATTQDEFTTCVTDHCLDVTEACGLRVGPAEGDDRYATPYGSANINISSTYILTNEQSIQQNMVTMGSFIVSGNVGNLSLINGLAQQSYYMTSMYTDQGKTYMQTMQYYTDSTGQNILNPVTFVVTDASAAVGNVYFGFLDEATVGQVAVVDVAVSGNSLAISCYHAFGEGNLTIQNLVAGAGSAGALAISGTTDLYSPANYAQGYGDITGELGANACQPQ